MQIDCVVEKLSYPIYSFILNAAWPKSIIFTGCILVLINCASISCQIVPSLGPYSMQIRWFDSFGSMDHQSSVSHWKVTNWASFHYLFIFSDRTVANHNRVAWPISMSIFVSKLCHRRAACFFYLMTSSHLTKCTLFLSTPSHGKSLSIFSSFLAIDPGIWNNGI